MECVTLQFNTTAFWHNSNAFMRPESQLTVERSFGYGKKVGVAYLTTAVFIT